MGGNPKYTSLLLYHLYIHKIISLADLAGEVSKSLSLVTKAILEMVKTGWVEEAGYAESSGGRKPILYQLKPGAGYTIVMAMDQYVSRIMMMDLANNLLAPPTLVNIDLAKDSSVAERIVKLLHQTIDNSGIPKEKILGIGMAMPGFVDFIGGVNYSFAPSPVKKLPLRDYLSKELRLPVFLGNDSSVVALAESTFGAAKAASNAMVVNISWGIGLGIVANRALYRGENGFAGEFSHIPLFNNGKICSCGKIGCLETETSLKIVLEKVADAINSGRPTILSQTFKADDGLEAQFLKFIQAVEKRDTLAIELLNESAYNIGKGIAVLIHILNPQKIVLSGRGAMAGKVWLPPIQQAINEHCIRRLAENIEIVVSDMAHQAELVGASALVVENIYT